MTNQPLAPDEQDLASQVQAWLTKPLTAEERRVIAMANALEQYRQIVQLAA